MKKALVHHTGRVEIPTNGLEFPVHPGIGVWRDVQDVVTERHTWDGTQFVLPPPLLPPTIISYETFQDRFTALERDAVTDFVFGIDLVTGKPSQKKLMQATQRAIASDRVDLLHPKTAAFMDALVAVGAITLVRKTAILTP